MTMEYDAERGRLADEVLKNPVYAESYEQVDKEIHRAWAAARSKDDREQLHQMLLMLTKVKGALESTMRNGRVAADEIQRKSLRQRIGLRLAG